MTESGLRAIYRSLPRSTEHATKSPLGRSRIPYIVYSFPTSTDQVGDYRPKTRCKAGDLHMVNAFFRFLTWLAKPTTSFQGQHIATRMTVLKIRQHQPRQSFLEISSQRRTMFVSKSNPKPRRRFGLLGKRGVGWAWSNIEFNRSAMTVSESATTARDRNRQI
ncbi:hypothetical protein BJX65DRAFT_177894 [Aspergillus insuetus]